MSAAHDSGNPMDTQNIQSRDERLKGLKISPHTFRRSCGTDMLNRGAPVEMVKEKLGHAKADTTLQCYAKISTEAVRDAERRFRGCIGGWRNERQRYGQDTVPVLSIQKNEKS